ncbi:hypothetical protein [Dickeya zeae]|uniref:hypothetical protein n=1 Tax=Dickeya zeae TaxID=204042 RepID=UPI001C62866A|nr:hypothetical protein [Dickeya zeae]
MNNKVKKLIISTSLAVASLLASHSALADWQAYKTVTLDGYNNLIPGGSPYVEKDVQAGVYRFRIDPTSAGVDYASGQAGNTQSKSAALRVYNRTSTSDHTASVNYYGLNSDGILAAGITHAFPLGGGFDLFLEDWQRSDDSGSVKVIIEKWQQ